MSGAVVRQGRWRSASEVAGEALSEINLLNEHPGALSLKTGIESFDEHAAAALEPGRLIVVAGKSGGGKTALLTQWAVAFSSQVPTLLCTLEDSERDLVKRAISQISRENVGLIRQGFPGACVPSAVTDAVGALAGLPLDVSDNLTSPTVEELVIEAVRWRRQHPDALHCVLMVDQLSHIRPSDPRSPVLEELVGLPPVPRLGARNDQVLEWQVDFLRKAAAHHGLTIVLAHQLNDNVSDTSKPQRSSIRDSRGIVHKADLVLAPHIPDSVNDPFAGPGAPATVPNTENFGSLVIIKARTVPEKDIPVRFVAAQQRFTDADANIFAKWTPEAAPTESQKKGAALLSKMRSGWEQDAAVRAGAQLPAAKTAAALPAAAIGDEDIEQWLNQQHE